MTHASGPLSHQLPKLTRSTRSSAEQRSAQRQPIGDVRRRFSSTPDGCRRQNTWWRPRIAGNLGAAAYAITDRHAQDIA